MVKAHVLSITLKNIPFIFVTRLFLTFIFDNDVISFIKDFNLFGMNLYFPVLLIPFQGEGFLERNV